MATTTIDYVLNEAKKNGQKIDVGAVAFTLGFVAGKALKVKGSPKVTIAYWHIRGLAAPLRMMASFSGLDADFTTYNLLDSKTAWSDAKPALVEKNPLMNLPYIIDGDLVLTQTDACMNYLGRKCGLQGNTSPETGKIEQVLAQTKDMRNSAVGLFYNKGRFNANLPDYMKSVITHYKKFSGWFKLQGTTYSCGNEVTSADFHLWEMLDQHELLAKATGAPSFLASYPALAKFYKAFRAHPKMSAYFASDMAKLPINNIMAAFGSTAANGLAADIPPASS